MVTEERLKELGLSQGDIAEFFNLEEEGRYSAQGKLLRRYRKTYLENVHNSERLISGLDYVLYEIRKEHSAT